MHRYLFFFMTLTSLFGASSAAAARTDEEKALARQLYEKAAAEMGRKEYAQACPRFEEASRLDPQHVRTLISLGTCEDRWGKLLSAQRRFEQARKWAVEQSAAEKIIEIDKLWADAKRRTPRIQIIVPERYAKSSGLTVVLNGTIINARDLGTLMPVDPGTYEITASSPDTGAWTAKIPMKTGHTARMTIGGAPEATYRTNEEADKDSLATSAPISSNRTQSGGSGRTVGFAGIGVGAAGVLVGSILGGIAISKNSASDDGHCDVNNYCDAVGTTLRWDAKNYGNASTALFAIGGALIAGGIILVATSAPTTKPTKPEVTANLWVGPGSVGLQGRW